jgi:hypothetical protein
MTTAQLFPVLVVIGEKYNSILLFGYKNPGILTSEAFKQWELFS